jgi:lipopolysaccharide transport protein LptA
MKTLWLILPTLTAAFILTAQTNPPAPATNATGSAMDVLPPSALTNAIVSTNALPRPSTEIFSDTADFDLKTRVAVYTGHVRVVDPQMQLLCEILTVTVPEGSGRVNHIVAETNVVIDAVDQDGKTVHASSGRAVYTYRVENSVTNETIVLTINPRLSRGVDSLSGDSILWDRQKNMFRASGNQRTTFVPDLPGTNQPTPHHSHTNKP